MRIARIIITIVSLALVAGIGVGLWLAILGLVMAW